MKQGQGPGTETWSRDMGHGAGAQDREQGHEACQGNQGSRQPHGAWDPVCHCCVSHAGSATLPCQHASGSAMPTRLFMVQRHLQLFEQVPRSRLHSPGTSFSKTNAFAGCIWKSASQSGNPSGCLMSCSHIVSF